MCAPEGRVMFFLVRSLFWLGLVFMALPWDGASLRDELVGEAQKATQIIVRETQSLCAKDPIGCAAQAISLGQAFDPGKAFDLADRPGMSQDTLQPGDRTPGWRGPATVTAARR